MTRRCRNDERNGMTLTHLLLSDGKSPCWKGIHVVQINLPYKVLPVMSPKGGFVDIGQFYGIRLDYFQVHLNERVEENGSEHIDNKAREGGIYSLGTDQRLKCTK